MVTLNDDYVIVDGIKCYALEAAEQNNNFNPQHFDRLATIESKHFWFRSRNRILGRLFKKYSDQSETANFLEIGCGTGFVLTHLARISSVRLYGAELHREGLRYAKARLPNVEFIQLDARHLPYHNTFSSVGAFDVLEHIKEDEQVIASVFASLKPGGKFFISVPQHRWLWSQQDENTRHKRRYTRDEILKKLHRAGFTVTFVTSFVFTLLPLMYLSRLRFKKSIHSTAAESEEYNYSEHTLSRLSNFLLEALMRIDEVLIAFGISLPIGGSLCLVAEKPCDP